MKNLLKDVKLMGYYALYDYPHFKDVMLRKLNLLTLKHSQYYDECDKYYSQLDVSNKNVLDMGSDYGTTPLYFILHGANLVVGYSMVQQYFFHAKYISIRMKLTLNNALVELNNVIEKYHLTTLKSDIEGIEWAYTPQFLEQFDDWIIALHNPVQNVEVHDYIQKHGKLLYSHDNICEFATYKKIL